jgi:hypothetical protein
VAGAGAVPPEVSFSSLVMSMALGALSYLHPAATQEAKPAPPQPELAKPVIAMLEVLKEKTRGNLTAEESGLLDSMLLELKVRYMKCCVGGREPTPAGESQSSPDTGSEDPTRDGQP